MNLLIARPESYRLFTKRSLSPPQLWAGVLRSVESWFSTARRQQLLCHAVVHIPAHRRYRPSESAEPGAEV